MKHFHLRRQLSLIVAFLKQNALFKKRLYQIVTLLNEVNLKNVILFSLTRLKSKSLKCEIVVLIFCTSELTRLPK